MILPPVIPTHRSLFSQMSMSSMKQSKSSRLPPTSAWPSSHKLESVFVKKYRVVVVVVSMILKRSFYSFRNRCCCFFKRKKKRSGRVKWLTVVRRNKEKEAVTLLHTVSQSNSRDSILNPVATWIRHDANRRLGRIDGGQPSRPLADHLRCSATTISEK